MTSEQTKNTLNASAGYAALRHGGAPAWRACAELGLEPARGAHLEQLFRARRSGGPDDPMKPRYARNGRHVADVLAAGGYPVLPARRR
ncbi:MAG: hypothetical protein E7812_07670 [Phenylobacterium sp.]|nr:MAG: hypothetical protein E7812_07670 [Phenylobacterium sp.]